MPTSFPHSLSPLLRQATGVASHLLSLLVVFLLLAATAVWTGRLFGHEIGKPSGTPDTPTESAPAPDAARLALLGIASDRELSPLDSAAWRVVSPARQEEGTVISTLPYARDVKGFAGHTPLYIYLDKARRIVRIAAADNADTSQFFDRALTVLLPRWTGRTPADALRSEVDAVSGATYSSRSIIANVQSALSARSATASERRAAPSIGWGRTAAVLAVLLLGVVAAARFRHKRWLRLTVLLLNVGVVGFWCGQYLSVSLLRSWVSSGLNPLAWLPALSMLLVAVLMSFCRRPHHYCSWVCPYGSLQELAALLPFPKIHCSPRTYRRMARIRIGALAVLLLLLWCGTGEFLLGYEPFGLLSPASAPPALIILGLAFIVAGCFVPRLWCRAVCPLGSLFDLSEEKK